jgi:putative ABC transport system permease protein
VLRATTLHDALADTVRERALFAWTFGAFAVVALAITGTGIFGLLTMATVRRVREIGVRRALGATGAGIVWLLVREHAVAVIAGLALGSAGAAWSTQLLEAFLFGVRATDAPTWTAAVVTLSIVAVVAVLMPAVRASRVNPVVALRTD